MVKIVVLSGKNLALKRGEVRVARGKGGKTDFELANHNKEHTTISQSEVIRSYKLI